MEREKVRALREAMEAALKSVEKEFSVVIEFGTARFNEQNARFKLEVSDVVGGKALTKQVVDWNNLYKSYGFKKKDLGRPFKFQGRIYKITGLLPRSRKFSVAAERQSDGKPYKFNHEDVLMFLKANA